MDPKIFSGQASRALTQKICDYLGIKIGGSDYVKFADGEFEPSYEENLRGRDVYIVQSTYSPTDNLMELLLYLDAAKRAAADSITAVIPYFGWARGDRKTRSRKPIPAKLVANLITVAGATRVMTIDLHSAQEQGFFDLPVDNLYARPVFTEFFSKNFNPEDFVVMGPDVGAAKLAEPYSQKLGMPMAMTRKTRSGPNKVKSIIIIGDVQGKNILLVDDIIDTAGTIIAVAEKLKENGAKDIYAFCTHGLFSKDAVSLIEKSVVTNIFVTDSIPRKNVNSTKIKEISIAPLLGEAIKRAHTNESVSSLFE